MDREVKGLSDPLCSRCLAKLDFGDVEDPWSNEPARIVRKVGNFEKLEMDPDVVRAARSIGKLFKKIIEIEQCNPLHFDKCFRPGLLREHKVKPGFRPIVIEGLDIQLKDQDHIEHLRALLPKGYTAYLYFFTYADKPRAIVCRRISDIDFVTARNTSGASASVVNQTIRRKLKRWKENYRANLIGALSDTIQVKFKKIPNNTERRKLVDEISKFCPDVKMSSDWRSELDQKLKVGERITLWWD